MNRQYVRLLRFLPLVFLFPLLWRAHSIYTFESHLRSLQISLSDFPTSYTEALTTATLTNAPTFDYDYSIFPLDPPYNSNKTNANDSESDSLSIPPIIHFIWFQDLYAPSTGPHASEIPHHGSNSPYRCSLWDPHFSLWTWNASAAEGFLSTNYPSILPTYNSYTYPIQRVDLLKYFLLYHYGGIYMDLDISCRRPLEPLMSGWPAWLPKARPWGVNNDLMASRKGHPLFEYMIGRLDGRNRWLGSEWLTVFWSTGPRFASDMVAEWVGLHPGIRKSERGDPNAFFILPEQFYSQDPGFTFFGHSPGGTWYGDDAKFVLWLLDRPWIFVVVVGTPVAVFLSLVARRHRTFGGWKSGKV